MLRYLDIQAYVYAFFDCVLISSFDLSFLLAIFLSVFFLSDKCVAKTSLEKCKIAPRGYFYAEKRRI